MMEFRDNQDGGRLKAQMWSWKGRGVGLRQWTESPGRSRGLVVLVVGVSDVCTAVRAECCSTVLTEETIKDVCWLAEPALTGRRGPTGIPHRVQVVVISTVPISISILFTALPIRLGLVPYRVWGDLLAGTFDPISGRWNQVVWVFRTELICNNKRESHWQNIKKWGRRPYTSIFVFISPTDFNVRWFEISQNTPPLLILRKYCPDRSVQGRLTFHLKRTF